MNTARKVFGESLGQWIVKFVTAFAAMMTFAFIAGGVWYVTASKIEQNTKTNLETAVQIAQVKKDVRAQRRDTDERLRKVERNTDRIDERTKGMQRQLNRIEGFLMRRNNGAPNSNRDR